MSIFNVDLWTDVELRANIDDGLLVWIDGEFVFGGTGPGEFNDEGGFDYRIELPDLEGGEHVIQIIIESRGPDAPEATFELRGTPRFQYQPDRRCICPPSRRQPLCSGWGLIGLVALRRRKSRG